MKAYVQPDFEVMTFAANEYISLCYAMGSFAGAGGGSCNASPDSGDKRFYDMDGNEITGIYTASGETNCNGATVPGPGGAATNYNVWAEDLEWHEQNSGYGYWTNGYYNSISKDSQGNETVSSTTYIVRFLEQVKDSVTGLFKDVWHYTHAAPHIIPATEEIGGAWTNMS